MGNYINHFDRLLIWDIKIMNDIFEKLTWGSHFCYFYENKVNLLKVLTSFFKDGLENNEYCIWVISDFLTEQEIKDYFSKNYTNFDEYFIEEQLKFYNYKDWYNNTGSINAKKIINNWNQHLNYALEKGYRGIRITGDVHLISREEVDLFSDYEIQFNSFIKEKFIKAICTYSNFKYKTYQILNIASTHQSVLIDINGTQKLIQHQEIKSNLKAKKILKKNLQNLQRIESIGLLSSGIIHDVKHSLSTIMGNINLALMKLDNGVDISEFLMQTKSAVDDSSKVINELFSFGQLNKMRVDISINQIIIRLVNLLGYLITDQIFFEMDLSQNLWIIQGDSGKIERILVNLINNARDAMPVGGKITIITKNLKLNKSKNLESITLDPGNYIILSVRDTGIGMNNSILPHIFEPYYTTKNSDKGTGLGLPMVYSYLNDFKGNIEVLSKPKEGTVFNIYIPAKQF